MTAEIFTNNNISEQNIPSTDELNFEKLEDNHSTVIFLSFFIFWIIILIGVSTVFFFIDKLHFFSQFWPVPVAYGALLLLVYIFSKKIAQACGFAIREKDIHFKSGVIWKKTVSLPFNRIQHVEMESGPMDRYFKLSTLKFFTAGGGTTDMKIPALSLERASKLRTFVIKKSGIKNDVIESSDNE